MAASTSVPATSIVSAAKCAGSGWLTPEAVMLAILTCAEGCEADWTSISAIVTVCFSGSKLTLPWLALPPHCGFDRMPCRSRPLFAAAHKTGSRKSLQPRSQARQRGPTGFSSCGQLQSARLARRLPKSWSEWRRNGRVGGDEAREVVVVDGFCGQLLHPSRCTCFTSGSICGKTGSWM